MDHNVIGVLLVIMVKLASYFAQKDASTERVTRKMDPANVKLVIEEIFVKYAVWGIMAKTVTGDVHSDA